ncbi:MAG TPA: hypothetical protein VG269_15390 [Tepidisphaeraceae bacterium]|nr:hypothetical protein [Tepidisphaeraceae bacterium]
MNQTSPLPPNTFMHVDSNFATPRPRPGRAPLQPNYNRYFDY